MKRLVPALACFVAAALSATAAAETFPDRPIQLVVPFAPGGATDLIARQIGKEMSQTLNRPVVVENRPGASGAIGSMAVSNAKADGYTLLLGVTTTHGINPVLNPQLRYDPVSGFTPISLVATMPHVLVVPASSSARSLNEFVMAARTARPSMTYGSAGDGSPQHLAGELLKAMFGFDGVHVPYKGGSPALADLMGGQIQFMSTQLAEAKPFVLSGKLRALAVAARERVSGFDAPTFAELGYPFELTAWYAVFGPAGVPAEVVTTINRAIVAALRTDSVRATMQKLDVTPVGSTPEELAEHVRRELEFWRKAVKTAGLQPPH